MNKNNINPKFKALVDSGANVLEPNGGLYIALKTDPEPTGLLYDEFEELKTADELEGTDFWKEEFTAQGVNENGEDVTVVWRVGMEIDDDFYPDWDNYFQYPDNIFDVN